MQDFLSEKWDQFRTLLFQQVDGGSLALFRISFGTVMFAHTVNYLKPQNQTSLKQFLYNAETFNFTYPGFGWVQPLPEPLWTLLFCLMGLAALAVALGVFYRAAVFFLFVSYTYIFLSEVAKYNNHYYLMCLVAFLLIFMPADRRYSLRNWWIRRQNPDAESLPTGVPFWTVFLLRAQLFVVYFYGGLAKINSDWLTGIPMVGKGREVLEFWTPILGLPEIEPLSVALGICWIGLIFDLSIGFLLICRRTRLLAILLTLVFHASNHFLFSIGVFPIMALSTTLIFFEPDWPSRFFAWIRKPRISKPDWRWALPGSIVVPVMGISLGWRDRKSGHSKEKSATLPWVIPFVVVFLAIQLLFPFRHFFIAGDANWTEEGQDFSWRMMLRAKDASHVIFHIQDTQLVTGESGAKKIEWEAWPEERSRMIFVPIEASRFRWEDHPGLTSTFEPGSGLRYIFRLSDGEDISSKSKALEAQWQKTFRRSVDVVETIGWKAAIPMLKAKAELSETPGELMPSIENIEKLTAGLNDQHPFARERHLATIAAELEFLLNSNIAESIQQVTRRLHPFLVQGATFPNERFLVVDDPSLTVNSKDPEKLTGGREFLVWIDLGRLRPTEWSELPQWIATFENRDLKILWNYSSEINRIQMTRFTTSPWMIRQFSRHLADRWEETTGRRPEVYVTSNLMLNYRTPQPLIDPDIDMARAGYSTLKHNPWILPLDAEVGSATKHAPEESPSKAE